MTEAVRAAERRETIHTVDGGRVRLVSYRLGDVWSCTADNVDPGAVVARARGASRDEVEREALSQAGERVAATRRLEV